MWLEQLQDEITARLDRGEDLDDVQEELIEPVVGLSEDERAALWLFGWSYQATGRHETERVPASLAW